MVKATIEVRAIDALLGKDVLVEMEVLGPADWSEIIQAMLARFDFGGMRRMKLFHNCYPQDYQFVNLGYSRIERIVKGVRVAQSMQNRHVFPLAHIQAPPRELKDFPVRKIPVFRGAQATFDEPKSLTQETLCIDRRGELWLVRARWVPKHRVEVHGMHDDVIYWAELTSVRGRLCKSEGALLRILRAHKDEDIGLQVIRSLHSIQMEENGSLSAQLGRGRKNEKILERMILNLRK